MKALQNFWYYHKTHVLIGLVALGVIGSMAATSLRSAEPDYDIGLVRAEPITEEAAAHLTSAIEAVCEDRNGDGQVLVQLHTYFADLANDAENAGYQNYEIIAALDADLIGKESGIFLLEDVDAFQQATNNLLREDFGHWEGFFLCVRKDASEDYVRLWERLQK